MRSRSSSKYSNNKSTEGEQPKHKEEPHLSGAYIRSLVKQLSSSRSRDPTTTNTQFSDASPESPNSQNHIQSIGIPAQQPPPPPPKKQVRRRLHTSRPYQERLLNMAEARREIVTALKFHRASMRQANEQQQQQQPPPPPLPQPSPPPLEELMDSRTNPSIYQQTPSFPNYYQTPSFSVPFTYPSLCTWACPPITPLPISDNLNLPLPNQPLGLNLSFQGFNNITTTTTPTKCPPPPPPPPPPPLSHSNNTKPPLHSPSSSSTSYSYSSPAAASGLDAIEAPPRVTATMEATSELPGVMLHPAMDDEGMAEIRSIGEQHDMVWNDTMNLVTSAWWSKFLKSMDVGVDQEQEGDGYHAFDHDELMGMPAWLSDGLGGDVSSRLLPQYFDDCNTDDYLQDEALPCLKIGEIEGLDGDWLS